jgi:hypothetical protein
MILPDVYWADTYFGDDNVPARLFDIRASRGCGWAFSALCVLVKQKEQKKCQILAILKNSFYLCS